MAQEADRVAGTVRAHVQQVQAELQRRKAAAQGELSLKDEITRLFNTSGVEAGVAGLGAAVVRGLEGKGKPLGEATEGGGAGHAGGEQEWVAEQGKHHVQAHLDAWQGQQQAPRVHVGQVSYAQDGLGRGGDGDDDDDNQKDDDEVFHFEIDGTGEGAVCVKSDDFKWVAVGGDLGAPAEQAHVECVNATGREAGKGLQSCALCGQWPECHHCASRNSHLSL